MQVDVVTGAAGLIGRALAAELCHHGSWVRGIDVRPGDEDLDMHEYVMADLREPAAAADALSPPAGCDRLRVWHLAAHHGGAAYMGRRSSAILADNVRIDANVSSAAASVGCDRMLYASSVAVYPTTTGNGRMGEDDALPAMPQGEYGWAKLTGERLVAGVSEPRIARLENCYGPPTVDAEQDGVLAGLCRRAATAPEGGVLEVWGDLDTERAFLWVDDAVRALITIMASDRREPVNVTSGEYVTIGRAAEVVRDASGKDLRIRAVAPPGESAGGHARPRLSDTVIRSLGWSPQVSLAEGVRRLYGAIDRTLAETGP